MFKFEWEVTKLSGHLGFPQRNFAFKFEHAGVSSSRDIPDDLENLVKVTKLQGCLGFAGGTAHSNLNMMGSVDLGIYQMILKIESRSPTLRVSRLPPEELLDPIVQVICYLENY